jgi:hypothetical protein
MTSVSNQTGGSRPRCGHARRRRLNVPFVCCYFFVFDTIELLESRIRGFVPPYSIPGVKRNTRRTAHHAQLDIAAWARGLAETKPSLCVCVCVCVWLVSKWVELIAELRG